jgi:hypothetical protein
MREHSLGCTVALQHTQDLVAAAHAHCSYFEREVLQAIPLVFSPPFSFSSQAQKQKPTTRTVSTKKVGARNVRGHTGRWIGARLSLCGALAHARAR